MMIEGYRVELDDVSLAALVIGVAGPAVLAANRLAATMKALFSFYILADFLMTFNTEPVFVLLFFFFFMTFTAFVLVFGMPFYHRARH